jgi:hypothetical protein
MRKFLIAAVAVSGLMLSSTALRAADDKAKDKKDKGVTGILIDSKCGSGKSMKDAAKHPASCALKCSADNKLGVTTKDDKWIELDDKGQKLAKEYLEKHKDDKDAKDLSKVHVSGKVSEDGKTIAVEDIKAAGKKGKDADKAKKES